MESFKQLLPQTSAASQKMEEEKGQFFESSDKKRYSLECLVLDIDRK